MPGARLASLPSLGSGRHRELLSQPTLTCQLGKSSTGRRRAQQPCAREQVGDRSRTIIPGRDLSCLAENVNEAKSDAPGKMQTPPPRGPRLSRSEPRPVLWVWAELREPGP